MNQFSGSQQNNFDLAAFLGECENFDFDPERIRIKKKVGSMELEEYEDSRRFLEDFMEDGVEHQSVEDWFRQACIGYKKHKDSTYRNEMQTYNSTVSIGSDEDEVDLRMMKLQDTGYDVTQEDLDMAILRLPFYIKAIWGYCLQYKANLFTFIAAYTDIKQFRSASRIQPIDFENYHLIALKKTGEFAKVFYHKDDMKQPKYREALDIFLMPGSHKNEMELINTFISICDIIGIRLIEQDFSKITPEFIDRIVCRYLPTVTEFSQMYTTINSDALLALDRNNIFGKTKGQIYSSTIQEEALKSFSEDLESKLEVMYNAEREYPTEKYSKMFLSTDKTIETFWSLYTRVRYGKEMDLSNTFDYRKGFLVRDKSSGEPILLDGYVFGKCYTYINYQVYLTIDCAPIVCVGDADSTFMMSPADAIRVLDEVYHDSKAEDCWVSI